MNMEEVRSNLNIAIKEKREVQGMKKVDGGILVPVELLAAEVKENPTQDLVMLVNKVKVNTSSGKYPIIAKSSQKMNTVAELEENPELAKPNIINVEYSVDTYRGYIPVSQELIDDSDYDITGLLVDNINEQGLATRNHAIATVLKTATAKQATGFDGLKDIINKEIKSIYNVVLIVTNSMFAALDKVKDKNGQYMLQPDVTSPTGYKFAGKTIYKVDDTHLGEENDLKAFIGDPKAFMTFFDRLQTTLAWTNNAIYGDLLGLVIRFGVKKVDDKAGFLVTYTPQG